MYFALNTKGKRIPIELANKEEQYFCPVCGGEVLIKKGDINAHHFAHKTLTECDKWSSDMSEWHKNWQEKFPENCREVVIKNGKEKHRADILINDTVIEFQHSPISPKEFWERNNFYTLKKYKVIWVFDCIEHFDSGRLSYDDERENLLIFKYTPAVLASIDIANEEDISLFLHMVNDDDHDQSVVQEIAWISPHADRFIGNLEDCYTNDEFVELFVPKEKEPKVLSGNDIFDELPEFNIKGDWSIRCPLKNNEWSCFENCFGCKHNVPESDFDRSLKNQYTTGCKAKYAKLIKDVKEILKIEKKCGAISEITYIDNNENNVKVNYDCQGNGMRLDDIINMSNAHSVIVSNMNNGYRFKIPNINYYKNRNFPLTKVFGILGKGYDGRDFRGNNKEIYYWDQPNWVLEWEINK